MTLRTPVRRKTRHGAAVGKAVHGADQPRRVLGLDARATVDQIGESIRRPEHVGAVVLRGLGRQKELGRGDVREVGGRSRHARLRLAIGWVERQAAPLDHHREDERSGEGGGRGARKRVRTRRDAAVAPAPASRARPSDAKVNSRPGCAFRPSRAAPRRRPCRATGGRPPPRSRAPGSRLRRPPGRGRSEAGARARTRRARRSRARGSPDRERASSRPGSRPSRTCPAVASPQIRFSRGAKTKTLGGSENAAKVDAGRFASGCSSETRR